MGRARFVGVADKRVCVGCGRALKDYQDSLCHECVQHRLKVILRRASRDERVLEAMQKGLMDAGLYLT